MLHPGTVKCVDNFYPRPPRGGRPYHHCSVRQGCAISIHALREEGDERGVVRDATRHLFLSTPSARRATVPSSETTSVEGNFYPRPPRGGRRDPLELFQLNRYFYPRPPRGGRLRPRGRSARRGYFYPRPPRGGRPARRQHLSRLLRISIHALREEGDYPLILPPPF